MESKKESREDNSDLLNMSNSEKKDIMLIDLILRIGALEKLLIDKGISSLEEIQEYLTSSHSLLAETYLKTLKDNKEG